MLFGNLCFSGNYFEESRFICLAITEVPLLLYSYPDPQSLGFSFCFRDLPWQSEWEPKASPHPARYVLTLLPLLGGGGLRKSVHVHSSFMEFVWVSPHLSPRDTCTSSVTPGTWGRLTVPHSPLCGAGFPRAQTLHWVLRNEPGASQCLPSLTIEYPGPLR